MLSYHITMKTRFIPTLTPLNSLCDIILIQSSQCFYQLSNHRFTVQPVLRCFIPLDQYLVGHPPDVPVVCFKPQDVGSLNVEDDAELVVDRANDVCNVHEEGIGDGYFRKYTKKVVPGQFVNMLYYGFQAVIQSEQHILYHCHLQGKWAMLLTLLAYIRPHFISCIRR